MRSIVAHRDDVEIVEKEPNNFIARVRGEAFTITKTALYKFRRMRSSVVKFLIDSRGIIVQTVSLDYSPVNNYKLAKTIKLVLGSDVEFVEYIVNDVQLWIRGYFSELDVVEGIKLAFSFFNRNDGHSAFKSMFGMYRVPCSNLAMFFESFSLIRLVHTWDELKYSDPLEIIVASLNQAVKRVREVLSSAPRESVDAGDVRDFLRFLKLKNVLTNYGVEEFYRYHGDNYGDDYTNWSVFDALTYVSSNVLYLRNRLDLIRRIDAVAYTVLTNPSIIRDLSEVYRRAVK